jgi:hypothetical protein
MQSRPALRPEAAAISAKAGTHSRHLQSAGADHESAGGTRIPGQCIRHISRRRLIGRLGSLRLQIDAQLLAFFVQMAALEPERPGRLGHAVAVSR